MSGSIWQMRLYTNDGKYVVTIFNLPWVRPPEVMMWGSRAFVRGRDGHYREGMAYYGLTSRTEPDAADVGRDVE